MKFSHYKSIETTRGFTYSYYFAAAKQSKPTILFCHGFPSSSTHWYQIATFFERQGYGIIVPDMLGYGETSKPTDGKDYVLSKISKDLVDILDAENIGRAIAVGHDWGSLAVSRLANHFPERFLAYAFFALPFLPASFPAPYETLLETSKAEFGYDLYGYWEYFASEEFESDFRANPDSFVNILFPSDPSLWVTHMAPRGALKRSMRAGFRSPLPPYITEDDKKDFIDTFIRNGLKAPTRWYDILVTMEAAKDNKKTIPEDRGFPPASAPIFFGAAKKDYICIPQQGYSVFASSPFQNHSVTLREFDGDHWIILSCVDEINKELLHWVEDVVVPKAHL